MFFDYRPVYISTYIYIYFVPFLFLIQSICFCREGYVVYFPIWNVIFTSERGLSVWVNALELRKVI